MNKSHKALMQNLEKSLENKKEDTEQIASEFMKELEKHLLKQSESVASKIGRIILTRNLQVMFLTALLMIGGAVGAYFLIKVSSLKEEIASLQRAKETYQEYENYQGLEDLKIWRQDGRIFVGLTNSSLKVHDLKSGGKALSIKE